VSLGRLATVLIVLAPSAPQKGTQAVPASAITAPISICSPPILHNRHDGGGTR
jgi:hypothetical protein